MIKKIVNSIRNEVNPNRLYENVKEVSIYHRIQASTGFREAAKHTKSMLEKYGIKTKIWSYPFSGNEWYLEQKSFKEWDCKAATLDMTYPKKMHLANYDAVATSIIQKSYPVDLRNHPVDLVYLEKGNDKEYYKDWDLNGKMLFIHDRPNGYLEWAVKEKGALGFVTDVMPRRGSDKYKLAESLTYVSFWWKDEDPETFGYVVSPLLGDTLVEICKQVEAEHIKDSSKPKYPQVAPFIDSKLYAGNMEVVEATIPGETDDAILMCAHLCHPRSSCNDNASGVAAGIETMRAIKALIDDNVLAKPKRTLKLILVPEMTGTYCYLSSINKKKIKAAINLDMVGGKQGREYGPITLTKLPYAQASFVGDLTALLMHEAANEVGNFGGGMTHYTNYHISNYSGGSDHILFSDPSIGMPCCMLGQWPDLNYHLYSDKLEVIDPEVLKYSTTVGASYIYSMANLDEVMLPSIYASSHVEIARRVKEIEESIETGMVEKNVAITMLHRVKKYYLDALNDYKRFFSKVPESVKVEKKYLNRYFEETISYICDIYKATPLDLSYDSKYDYIVKRTYVAPINDLNASCSKTFEGKEAYTEFSKVLTEKKIHPYFAHLDQVEMYINGRNSVSDIAKLIFGDFGKSDIEIIDAYVQLLVKCGLAERV